MRERGARPHRRKLQGGGKGKSLKHRISSLNGANISTSGDTHYHLAPPLIPRAATAHRHRHHAPPLGKPVNRDTPDHRRTHAPPPETTGGARGERSLTREISDLNETAAAHNSDSTRRRNEAKRPAKLFDATRTLLSQKIGRTQGKWTGRKP